MTQAGPRYAGELLAQRVEPERACTEAQVAQAEQALEAAQSKLSAYQREHGILATDERATVAVNVHTGSKYWKTHYHPQELGAARAESLHYHAEVTQSVGGRLPAVDMTHGDLLRTREGERMNYFVFADVWYATTGFAVDAHGLAEVRVNGVDTLHRLGVSTPGPGRAEAFAFAMHFNAEGPLRESVQVHTSFQEVLSFQSTLGVLTFIFAVATQAQETHPGLDGLPPVGPSN